MRYPLKLQRSLRLAREKARCGRQREACQQSALERAAVTRACAMMAQAPWSSAATDHRRGAAGQRAGHRHQLEPPEVHLPQQQRLLGGPDRREHEAERQRGHERTHLGLSVEPGHRGARRRPTTVNTTPLPTVSQNAVQRSSSLSVLRCTRAAPKARSEKTSTRLAKTSAAAARPYSPGVSRRAMTIATTNRVSCSMTWDAPTQARPRVTR